MDKNNYNSTFYIFSGSLVASLGSFNFGYGMGVMNTILEIVSA
jgi:MFS family permease